MKYVKSILLAVLLSCIIGSTYSQNASQGTVSKKGGFNYQAVARNADGELLVNQSLGIRVSILEGHSEGRVIYQEEHMVTTDAYGLINIKVGQGKTGKGDMKLIRWGDVDYFIKIEGDPKGGSSYEEIGTSQIMGAPFAMKALEAESVAGGNNNASRIGSYWSATGDGGTNAGTNFLGTTDSVDLVLRVKNLESMRLTANGSGLGVGTTTPGKLGGNSVGGKSLHVKTSGFSNNHAKLILESGTGGTPGFLMWEGAGTANQRLVQHLVTGGKYIMRSHNDNFALLKDNIFSASLTTGNVSIGTTPSATYKLQVNGTFKSNGITESSDRRWKKEIKPLESALEKVLQLRGVNYKWKKEEYKEKEFKEGLQMGLIAQEVEEVVPEVVDTDDQGYKSVRYSNLVALLIEAIKEQQALIEEQKKKIAEGETKVDLLQSQLNNLVKVLENAGIPIRNVNDISAENHDH